MKKKCNVVMLATIKGDIIPKGTILAHKINRLTISDIDETKLTMGKFYNEYTPQHLYITSDDEIKEGIYVTDGRHIGLVSLPENDGTVTEKVRKTLFRITDQRNNVHCGDISDFKVILASTDKSLNLPLIPQSFIQEYIEKQGKIDEVFVEIITQSILEKTMGYPNVIITTIKDTYTREEVIKLLIGYTLELADENPKSAEDWLDKQ